MKKLAVLAMITIISASGVSVASADHHKHHRHHGMMNGNNPTHTRHDPPGTRTQCRGGCD